MWTDTIRVQDERKRLALPSDLTDAEWSALEPFFPPPSDTGRPRKWPLRRVVEAILYLLCGSLPWRMLPPCFPLTSTLQRWFYLWREAGLWALISHDLLQSLSAAQSREASSSAGVIHSADIQDRDGASIVLAEIVTSFPWLRHLLADGGYAGQKLRSSLARLGQWTIEIIKRSDRAKSFEILPRRWVVERTLALNRQKPPPRKGLRDNHRLSNRMALCSLCPTSRQTHRKARNLLAIVSSQTLNDMHKMARLVF